MRRRNRKKWRKAPQAASKSEKCRTKWCRNQRAKKADGYYLALCWKCRSRLMKINQPATYVLNMLRHSAHKRKLPFTITLAEFKEFCAKTGYLEKRGNKPDSLTIDRIDWNDGYHIHNIQVLTHAENSAQGSDNTPRDQRAADEDDALPAPDAPPLENEPY